MASNSETYMLYRDAAESERLDYSHRMWKACVHDHLLHPMIMRQEPILRIADVATGTGVWLLDFAKSHGTATKAGKRRLIGFDISNEQFPKPSSVDDLEFVVHDARSPFPERWHGFFDVVHIRLLTFGIKAEEVDSLVRNIAEIVRPGGFIDWQEGL